MVRQQLLGDHELLYDCIAGREDPELRLGVSDRIRMARYLADQVGIPENPDRRRGERTEGGLLVFIRPTLTLVTLVATVTALIQLADQWVGHLVGAGALYAPIVAVASMRYGRKVGLGVVALCIATSVGTALITDADYRPFVLDLRSLALLIGLSALAWVTRREAITAWIDSRRVYRRG